MVGLVRMGVGIWEGRLLEGIERRELLVLVLVLELGALWRILAAVWLGLALRCGRRLLVRQLI